MMPDSTGAVRGQFQSVLNKLRRLWQSPTSRPVLIITFFTLISRVLGFVRTALIYQKLYQEMGGLKADLLLSAGKVPEFLSIFLLIGTIYSSTLPIASKLENKSETTMNTYLNLILITVLGTLLVTLGGMWIFMEPILRLLTSQDIWSQAQQNNLIEEYILTSRVLLLGPISFAIQAVFSVFLTLKKRFGIFATAGIIANLGSIAGLILSEGSFLNAAIGMVWGGLLASTLYIWAAFEMNYELHGFTIIPKKLVANFQQFNIDLVETWKVFLPRIFIIDSIFAAGFIINPIGNQGDIAALDMGLAIQGAFFIIVTSLGTVFFPDLAKSLHDSTNPGAFWKKMDKYLRTAFLLGVAVTGLTIIGSPILMYVLIYFGKGGYNAEYIIFISQVSALGLLFRSYREILGKYFYVKERLWQPVIFSVLSLFAQIAFTFFIIQLKVFSTGISVALSIVMSNAAWFFMAWSAFRFDKHQELRLTKPENPTTSNL